MKKNFKKKCLAWVTAVVLALAAVPVASMSGVVSAAEDGTDSTTIDGVTYTISGEKEAKVTSGADATGEVVIPKTVEINGETYNVTSIGAKAFEGNENIVSVSLGNNVTTLEDNAFYACTELTSVSLGTGLKELSIYSLASCYKLESIDIPYGVTEIPRSTFEFDYKLKSVSIPASVTSIGNSAFGYCYALESIELPKTVTSIEWMAFHDCTSMASISIPKSVTYMEGATFEGCESLTNIIIPCDFDKTMLDPKDENSTGACIVPLDDDNYQVVRSEYYQYVLKGEVDNIEPSPIIATGTFTYTHDIEYKADGDTITYACTGENCDVNKGGVTVVAPAELEYTGNAITATLSGEITGVSAPAINYMAAEGSKLTDGKPVEAGTYTASITIEGVTASVDFTITAKTPDEPDNSDPSNENDETDNSGETNETDEAETIVITPQIDKASPVQTASVSAPKEKLLESESFFTEEEKQELANNANLEVTLNVKSVEENAVPTEDKKEITDEMTSIKASSAVHYLDLSLMKKVGSRPATAVSNPGTDISITIGIPDDMLNSNTSVKRTYVVIRLHIEGTTREVTPLYGNFDDKTNQFTFATDRFSTYALTYIDTESATVATEPSASPNPEKPTTETPTTAPSGDDDDTDLTDDAAETSSTGTLVASENRGNTSTGAANATNTASADIGASSPKTADTANIPAMAALMALAGVMALIGVKAGQMRRR